MNPKISIIIPVYNVEKYLEKCLSSVLNQTLDSLEVIAINDGSTDGSLEILEHFSNQHQRLKVINQVNQGVSAAINKGLSLAQGEYIGFVDADDYIDQSMLMRIKDALYISKCDICFWGYTRVELQNNVEIIPTSYDGHKSPELLMELIENNLFGLVWNKAIKREIIESNGIAFDVTRSVFEDQQFTIKVWEASKNVCCENSSFYFYVINPASTMSSVIRKGIDKYFEIHDANLRMMMEFMLLNRIDVARYDCFAYKYAVAEAGNILRLLCQVNSKEILRAFQVVDCSKMIRLFRQVYPRFRKHRRKEVALFYAVEWTWIWRIPLFRRLLKAFLSR